MKKKSLKMILLILVCAIMFVSGGVLAVSLTAKDIGFTSINEGWHVDNVEDAMNDLYSLGIVASNAKIYKLGEGTSFDISSIVGQENVGNYTEDNFLVAWSAPNGGMALVYDVYEPGTHSSYTTATPGGMVKDFVKEYDEATGTITITGGTYKIDMKSYNPAVGDTRTAGAELSVTPVVYFLGGLEIQ